MEGQKVFFWIETNQEKESGKRDGHRCRVSEQKGRGRDQGGRRKEMENGLEVRRG